MSDLLGFHTRTSSIYGRKDCLVRRAFFLFGRAPFGRGGPFRLASLS